MWLPCRRRAFLCSLAVASALSFSEALLHDGVVIAAGPQETLQPAGGATAGVPTAARGQAPVINPDQSRWTGTVQCTLKVSTATYQETQTHTWRMVPGD